MTLVPESVTTKILIVWERKRDRNEMMIASPNFHIITVISITYYELESGLIRRGLRLHRGTQCRGTKQNNLNKHERTREKWHRPHETAPQLFVCAERDWGTPGVTREERPQRLATRPAVQPTKRPAVRQVVEPAVLARSKHA